MRNAGRIHQDIDLAELLQHHVMQRLHRGAIEHVAGCAKSAPAPRFDLRRNKVHLLAASRAGNHVRTRVRQAQRNGMPKPRGSTGDDGHPAVQIKKLHNQRS